MSQYYDLGAETLWNPSQGASRAFRRHVALHEAELGVPSGIGPMVNDECRIDPAVFAVFVDALLARHRRTRHAVLLALSEGFTATVLALALRAGVDIRWDQPPTGPNGELRDLQLPYPFGMPRTPGAVEGPGWADGLRERAREPDRHMAR
ncbi:DUF6086 family protein [Streptomyces jumonjinensis]|uniref:DUF6086 family protein n=1 Tax=Streptomyces jumonjinensis TaxID=1945 RepID=UPI0037A317ED